MTREKLNKRILDDLDMILTETKKAYPDGYRIIKRIDALKWELVNYDSLYSVTKRSVVAYRCLISAFLLGYVIANIIDYAL